MTQWVLVILDGFGLSEDKRFNGIAQAKTPYLDFFMETYPHSFLEASEENVGLPKGQMGNSEVGHLTMGAGRVVRQGLGAIDHAIAMGEFEQHLKLKEFIHKSVAKRCHLMGLFSDGGVHSHITHFIKAAEILASHGITVFLHLFTDGRDTSPMSVQQFLPFIPQRPLIIPATIQGRFYAMDRDHRWERTERAFSAMVKGQGKPAPSFEVAIAESYAAGVSDEFIEPCVIGDYDGVQEGDSLFHINFRSDRVRQLLASLVLPTFKEFETSPIKWSSILGMSDYSEILDPFVPALYPSTQINDGLCQTLACQDKKILKVAETEKYAHVTFFFNGGMEEPVVGEDRILIPSPKVSTYDLAPEMSARAVANAVCKGMKKNIYDLIVVNFANPDMVGHTGIQSAIIKAIECVDECLGKLYDQAKASGYALMITADHGNAEYMVEDHDPSKPHTAHTCNPVPVFLVNSPYKSIHQGTLADIAPTLLKSMHVEPPSTMTGQCLMDA
ncbi:MAG: 2,3-bisphosphoglycerate-independent phosphoglycerate mutase [Alphaproteobacteria bacterium]|nr:2,3-bisphosphoglycerate-independent phosphoglycerate mutase [Alphaproteobacteria bacterium]